jgi:hypothetical protein
MTTLRKLHISNSSGRNAVIVASSKSPEKNVVIGKEGKPAEFRRYIAGGRESLHEDLVLKLGKDDYSAELISGDPEIDFDFVGKTIDVTQSLLLDSKGAPVRGNPKAVEITLDAGGKEVSRRDPVEVAATVNDAVPVRWAGKKLPKTDLIRKFSIKRTMQLRHVDGVTYDFLFAMAEELEKEKAVVLLGAGEDGKQPLILQLNGTPYRGFLEGRTNGKDYILLLHLSNMELKKPAITKEEGDE